MKKYFSPYWLYFGITGIAFLAFLIVFLFFPRSRYSELEKRELKDFPVISEYTGKPSKLTSDISEWFGDTEPFRDQLMTLSMAIRDALKFRWGDDEETVSVIQTVQSELTSTSEGSIAKDSEEEETELIEGNAKLGSSGTIIVGQGENVRALMIYGGSSKSGDGFIKTVNEYAEVFPDINIYAMVAPLATDFYLPEKAKKNSNPQLPTINHIKEGLSKRVKFVDVYEILKNKRKENIYLRTDHHWSPLGAYYAASKLAEAANVSFPSLDSYEEKTVKDFVGTMYGYSKDISIKKAPEDFVYYIPKDIKYQTTFITYNLNKDFSIRSESKPFKGSFFKTFKDGASGAYSTFMGGDRMIVKVETDTRTPRKLLIIKDSYGNALPGYFFLSFSEVHVVDFRYFTKNMQEYVKENGITDIAFTFNTFNVCSTNNMKKVSNFLYQKNGISGGIKSSEKKITPENDVIHQENIPVPEESGIVSEDASIVPANTLNEEVREEKTEEKNPKEKNLSEDKN